MTLLIEEQLFAKLGISLCLILVYCGAAISADWWRSLVACFECQNLQSRGEGLHVLLKGPLSSHFPLKPLLRSVLSLSSHDLPRI